MSERKCALVCKTQKVKAAGVSLLNTDVMPDGATQWISEWARTVRASSAMTVVTFWSKLEAINLYFFMLARTAFQFSSPHFVTSQRNSHSICCNKMAPTGKSWFRANNILKSLIELGEVSGDFLLLLCAVKCCNASSYTGILKETYNWNSPLKHCQTVWYVLFLCQTAVMHFYW